MRKPDTDQEESLQWLDRLFGDRQDIVTFSGLYIPEKREFIMGPDFYSPTVEGSRGGFATEDSKRGDLLIKYKKGDKIISQRKFVSELEISILTNEGAGKTESLDIVPIVVSLPVKGYYGNDDKELIISLIDEKGNQLKELFRQNVYKWQR